MIYTHLPIWYLHLFRFIISGVHDVRDVRDFHGVHGGVEGNGAYGGGDGEVERADDGDDDGLQEEGNSLYRVGRTCVVSSA